MRLYISVSGSKELIEQLNKRIKKLQQCADEISSTYNYSVCSLSESSSAYLRNAHYYLRLSRSNAIADKYRTIDVQDRLRLFLQTALEVDRLAEAALNERYKEFYGNNTALYQYRDMSFDKAVHVGIDKVGETLNEYYMVFRTAIDYAYEYGPDSYLGKFAMATVEVTYRLGVKVAVGLVFDNVPILKAAKAVLLAGKIASNAAVALCDYAIYIYKNSPIYLALKDAPLFSYFVKYDLSVLTAYRDTFQTTVDVFNFFGELFSEKTLLHLVNTAVFITRGIGETAFFTMAYLFNPSAENYEGLSNGVILAATAFSVGILEPPLNWIKNNSQLIVPLHYSRNALNFQYATEAEAIAAGWTLCDPDKSICHMNHHENVHKYMFGHFEAVYNENGILITDPADMGTYNVVPYLSGSSSGNALLDMTETGLRYVGHFAMDVAPWIVFGNSYDDPTTVTDRLTSLMGITDEGTKSKIQEYRSAFNESNRLGGTII